MGLYNIGTRNKDIWHKEGVGMSAHGYLGIYNIIGALDSIPGKDICRIKGGTRRPVLPIREWYISVKIAVNVNAVKRFKCVITHF